MRKHFIKLILVILISITFGISNVKASCGDLVYDVLDMKITNEKIVVDGWAFIHHTQNGKNLSGKNTNQKIKINLCSEDGKCYFEDGKGIINGSGFNFDRVMAYNGIVEYRYQNIGFKQEFAIEEIKNKFGNNSDDQKLYFTIAVTNDDYNDRYSKCTGTEIFNNMVGTNHDYIESGKYWVKEKLKILKTVISGSIKNDETIEVTATGTDKLLYTGWHTYEIINSNVINIGWGQIYEYKGMHDSPKYSSDSDGRCTNTDTSSGTYTIEAYLTEKFWSISDGGWRYYTCANYDEKGNKNYEYINIKEYQNDYGTTYGFCKSVYKTSNGEFKCNTIIINPISSDTYKCNTGNKLTFNKSKTYAKVYGETTLNIKIKDDKKCEVSEPSGSTNMSCNDWTNLSSTCDELTVKEGNSSAIVKITQNGYISNIFKSNLVNTDTEYNANSYDGGWFQYAIVYRNEVSFTTNNLNGNIDDINSAMKSRIKSLNTFNDDINLVITGLENITGTKLIKSCTDSGSFTDGNTLVTTCTFFLPSSLIDELGKIVYSEDETTANVTNKYYIDFNKKDYKVSVTLENLSRLSDNQAIEDSKVKNKAWFGTWEVKTGCNLKVTNRLIETDEDSSGDGKTKYKFIYRPIDLKNPFPSRFPGVNWYNWYIIDKNKDKKTLEDSYKKLNYYTILDNKTISEIKEYNKNNDYFGSVDEEFFKEYIKEGGS